MVYSSHQFLLPVLHKQAICIDATMGNGKDTLFFLKQNVHTVYAFEIQKEVYTNTVSKIENRRFKPYCIGHERMDEYVHKEVDAIVFNFGYCPGFDSSITTTLKTSLVAVEKAISLLKQKGRLALVFYPHEEGLKEAKEIENQLRIRKDINCIKIETFKENSPYLIGVEKE